MNIFFTIKCEGMNQNWVYQLLQSTVSITVKVKHFHNHVIQSKASEAPLNGPGFDIKEVFRFPVFCCFLPQTCSELWTEINLGKTELDLKQVKLQSCTGLTVSFTSTHPVRVLVSDPIRQSTQKPSEAEVWCPPRDCQNDTAEQYR